MKQDFSMQMDDLLTFLRSCWDFGRIWSCIFFHIARNVLCPSDNFFPHLFSSHGIQHFSRFHMQTFKLSFLLVLDPAGK